MTGAAITGIGLVLGIRQFALGPVILPPPRSDIRSPHPAYEDFVGAETCGACHTSQYASWKGSTHGRAGGPPTADVVVAPFNGVPLTFKDAVVVPTRSDGEFVFTVRQDHRPTQRLQVHAVVGGGFMAGGGTQAFFTRFPDGTMRFLPFDFSTAAQRWFCNTLGRANRGSVPITPDLALADCGDWPPSRTLGSSERYQGCQQCHGSQIDVVFDTTARSYDTRFSTLAINCESCHGPGREHVELARSGGISTQASIGMRRLDGLTKDASLQICFQCHAVKATLNPQYWPGKSIGEHYALKLPSVLDTLYFPDGRTRAFAYQEGHLSSDCYRNGSMTCVDCHDPHTQNYRNIAGARLPGRFDNGQCVDCHPSKAEPLSRHTNHAATSPGSRCTSCHMPYLQEPSVGRQIRYARSDHTISIPRPAFDASLGLESACLQCHREQTAEALQDQVVRWYGELKPLPSQVSAAITADSLRDPAAASRAAVAADSGHPMAEFAALKTVMWRHLGTDLETLDGETTSRLRDAAAASDPDVRALALATLHLLRGNDRGVRRFLARTLSSLGSQEAAVRDRWAWILEARANTFMTAGDYRTALLAFERASEIRPGDPRLVRAAGVAQTKLRDYPQAAARFMSSLALDPNQPQVWVELGFIHMQQGDLDRAMNAYQQAVTINPAEASAYANLGIVHLRRGEMPKAVGAFVTAVSLDPSLAEASFLLASTYSTLGLKGEALRAVEQGLEYDRQNEGARRMRETLLQAGARRAPR